MAKSPTGYVHMGQSWADGSRIWLTVNTGSNHPEAAMQASLVGIDTFAQLLALCTTDGDDLPSELLAEMAADYGVDTASDTTEAGD